MPIDHKAASRVAQARVGAIVRLAAIGLAVASTWSHGAAGFIAGMVALALASLFRPADDVPPDRG